MKKNRSFFHPIYHIPSYSLAIVMVIWMLMYSKNILYATIACGLSFPIFLIEGIIYFLYLNYVYIKHSK